MRFIFPLSFMFIKFYQGLHCTLTIHFMYKDEYDNEVIYEDIDKIATARAKEPSYVISTGTYKVIHIQ